MSSLCFRVNATWWGTQNRESQCHIITQVLLYCGAYGFLGGHRIFPGIVPIRGNRVNRNSLNDLYHYIRNKCEYMEAGSILTALIFSEQHFYVLLVDIHNKSATIWDPDNMRKLNPDTYYYWDILKDICSILQLHPVEYAIETEAPDHQWQLIRNIAYNIYDYGSWGLCGIVALSMMLHTTICAGRHATWLGNRGGGSGLEIFITRFLTECAKRENDCVLTLIHTLSLTSSINTNAPICWLYDVCTPLARLRKILYVSNSKCPFWSTCHVMNARRSTITYMIGWPISTYEDAIRWGWCTETQSIVHKGTNSTEIEQEIKHLLNTVAPENRLIAFAHIAPNVLLAQ